MKIQSLLLAFLSFLPLAASAESVEELLQKMQTIQADPAAMQQAIQTGEERARLCFSCHGKDGNSKRDYIPNLANQNAAYLFTQFEHFANGTRKDYVMSKLATQLSGDERVAIALYFADRKVQDRNKTIPSSPRGKQIYDTTCFVCHGAAGHGNETYPRIAGQPYEFLVQTLQRFKENDPDRANTAMAAILRNMSQVDIDSVASYVTHMP